MSRMHRIFQIDELIREITKQMFTWYSPQRIVLGWALTCKAISDPALDVLWETQDSLVNLLKTLPSDIWEMNRRKLHFTRVPTRYEWGRFENYRRRIYNLQVNEEPDWDGLSTRVYQLLDLHFPNGSFLPNLQRLTCFIDWEHFTWIKLFLPPSLLYIDLNTFETKTDPIAGPVLELLPMESLQALHLEDFPLDAASVRTLSSCLLKLSGPLQDLIVYHKISSDAAVHISQLSNLRVLGISFRESNFTLPRATDRFPALKSLYAQVDDNLDWLGLLKDMRAGLMYLSISWVEGLVPPPTFTHQLVSALRTSGAQDTLRTLRINASKPWDISGTEMTPLLSLHNLTNLEIQTPCHEDACAFDLADADVAQLASSLRKLKTLILGGPRCVHPSSRFTMDGLFFLSKYCTSLNDLEVHFNAPQSRIFDHSAFTVDEGRVPIQNLLNRASNCSLRWLYVHELPFPTAPNSVGVMTYFLIHLFPHLDTIAQTGSLSGSWAETQRGIQAWQAFRRITVPGGMPGPVSSQ